MTHEGLGSELNVMAIDHCPQAAGGQAPVDSASSIQCGTAMMAKRADVRCPSQTNLALADPLYAVLVSGHWSVSFPSIGWSSCR